MMYDVVAKNDIQVGQVVRVGCPARGTLLASKRLDAYLRAAGADVTLDWHEGGHEVRPSEVDAARRLLAGVRAAEEASNV